MASSTTIPSTTISAAIETWCNSMPKAFSRPKVAEMVTGIATAETRATRNGSSSIVTRITEAMAIPNSRIKCFTRSATTAGWSATKSIFRSGGNSGRRLIQGSVKLLAEIDDIVAFLHLHREQNGALAS